MISMLGPAGAAAAAGSRAAGSETVARERAAGNKRLQHAFGLGETVCCAP